MWSSQPSSNSSNIKTLGMTSAISTATPKALDLQKTQELQDALSKRNTLQLNIITKKMF